LLPIGCAAAEIGSFYGENHALWRDLQELELAIAVALQYKCSRGEEALMARFTIDTDQQFDRNLDDLVNMTGGTKADVLRRALATYKYLKTEDLHPGNKVSITNKDNVVVKDVILP
jgi:hypothetical protein